MEWLYELATVVDDYLMKITEVVRGEDLLYLVPASACFLTHLAGVAPIFIIVNCCLGRR